MLLTSSSLLQLSPLKPSKSSPFLNGFTIFPDITKPFSSLSLNPCLPRSLPVIKAMRNMQGRVVCATNDKTVAVEVTRLAPHPKYKRRVRKKKKYQAHDPENQFKVGDFVQLEKVDQLVKPKPFSLFLLSLSINRKKWILNLRSSVILYRLNGFKKLCNNCSSSSSLKPFRNNIGIGRSVTI